MYRLQKDHGTSAVRSWALFLLSSALCWYFLSQTRAESIHFLHYGLLSLLGMFICPRPIVVMPICCLFGVADEAAQIWLRELENMDWNDAVFNALGSWLGLLCFPVLRR